MPDWDTRDQEAALAEAEAIQDTLRNAAEKAEALAASLDEFQKLTGFPERMSVDRLVMDVVKIRLTINQMENH